jgi:hypothetical protein
MKKPPRYVINPLAVTDPIWIPELHQLTVGVKNKSYLNSLWLGVGWNLMSFPQSLFKLVLLPFFNFRFLAALLGLTVFPLAMARVLWGGITGRCCAVDITIEQAINCVFLTPEQCRQALDAGCNLIVLDMMLLVAQERGLLPQGVTIPGHPKQSV